MSRRSKLQRDSRQQIDLGYSSLKPLQEEVVVHFVTGHDVFAILQMGFRKTQELVLLLSPNDVRQTEASNTRILFCTCCHPTDSHNERPSSWSLLPHLLRQVNCIPPEQTRVLECYQILPLYAKGRQCQTSKQLRS